jgi:hypothetical protein
MGIPSEATCPSCGLRMYLTEHGIGWYPREGMDARRVPRSRMQQTMWFRPLAARDWVQR